MILKKYVRGMNIKSKRLLHILLILLTSAVISVIAGISEWIILQETDISTLMGSLEVYEYLFFMGTISAELVFIISLITLSYYLAGIKPAELGFKRTKSVVLLFTIAAGILAPFIGLIINLAAGTAEIISINANLYPIGLSILFYLLIAFYEELLFRGFIITGLKEIAGTNSSLIISSALFTAAHAMNPNLTIAAYANIFIAGWFLGVLFLRTGSIAAPFVFHFLWNTTMGLLLGFNVSGFSHESIVNLKLTGTELMNGGLAGFEGSLPCTIILISLIFYSNKKINKIIEK